MTPSWVKAGSGCVMTRPAVFATAVTQFSFCSWLQPTYTWSVELLTWHQQMLCHDELRPGSARVPTRVLVSR